MSEPHRFNLRVEPHALACFTCAKFGMDDSADVAWCAAGDPQFPALCARYEHRYDQREIDSTEIAQPAVAS